MTNSSDNPKKRVAKKTPQDKSKQQKATPQRAVANTEKVVDKAVEKATKKAAEHVSPEVREKMTNFGHQADSFANEVEKVGDEFGKVADSILPPSSGSDAAFTAEYSKNVSRLFIFRCLWMIIQGPVIAIWSIRYCLVSIVHYISMFVTGTRTRSLREKQTRYRRHVITWKSYLNALTDKRPAILVD